MAALCIMQFTYTFPPILMLGLEVKIDALQSGEGFDPATGRTVRHDSGLKRWTRGFFAKQWYVKVFNALFFLGSVATAALGMYSSIEGIIGAFGEGRATAFSCVGPI